MLNGMKPKTKSLRRPVRSRDVPATASMLHECEDRLIYRMDAGFEKLRGEIHGIKSELKSDIQNIKSDVQSIRSEIHRIGLIVEEQNARNKFVMDGYAQIYELLINRGQA